MRSVPAIVPALLLAAGCAGAPVVTEQEPEYHPPPFHRTCAHAFADWRRSVEADAAPAEPSREVREACMAELPDWWRDDCRAGEKTACYAIGAHRELAGGDPEADYRRACELRHLEACASLGAVSRDLDVLMEACGAGIARACITGARVATDPARQAEFNQAGCDQGARSACMTLAQGIADSGEDDLAALAMFEDICDGDTVEARRTAGCDEAVQLRLRTRVVPWDVQRAMELVPELDRAGLEESRLSAACPDGRGCPGVAVELFGAESPTARQFAVAEAVRACRGGQCAAVCPIGRAPLESVLRSICEQPAESIAPGEARAFTRSACLALAEVTGGGCGPATTGCRYFFERRACSLVTTWDEAGPPADCVPFTTAAGQRGGMESLPGEQCSGPVPFVAALVNARSHDDMRRALALLSTDGDVDFLRAASRFPFVPAANDSGTWLLPIDGREGDRVGVRLVRNGRAGRSFTERTRNDDGSPRPASEVRDAMLALWDRIDPMTESYSPAQKLGVLADDAPAEAALHLRLSASRLRLAQGGTTLWEHAAPSGSCPLAATGAHDRQARRAIVAYHAPPAAGCSAQPLRFQQVSVP